MFEFLVMKEDEYNNHEMVAGFHNEKLASDFCNHNGIAYFYYMSTMELDEPFDPDIYHGCYKR